MRHINVTCQHLVLQKLYPSWPQILPVSRPLLRIIEILLFPSSHGIMQETEYPGVAQLVAHVIWEREAGVRAALLQNPGKLWDAKADGVLPLAGNWSKTGVDPIFDHSWKTS